MKRDSSTRVGERPSSGAATPGIWGSLSTWEDGRQTDIAAPEDGRSPGPAEASP